MRQSAKDNINMGKHSAHVLHECRLISPINYLSINKRSLL